MLSRILAATRVDPFLLMILVTVTLAALLPADGVALEGFTWASKVAIGLLFFLYGARLSSGEILHGARHWRLQLAILVTTFVVFPLLGLALHLVVPSLLGEQLYLGVLYLCVLPSTVQSAIALTSVARGNIPAAIVAASASSLLGIFITPLLVGVLISARGGGIDGSAVGQIVVMLLLPFLAGQVARRWIGRWVSTHGKPLKVVDRGSILLVVYVAFSKGMNDGIWSSLSVGRLALLALVCLLLLMVVLAGTWWSAQRAGFSREDSVSILFCGSTKSLATGLPMATVLFADQSVGLIVLPIMLYHQMQLIIGAVIASRLDKAAAPTGEAGVSSRRAPAAAR